MARYIDADALIQDIKEDNQLYYFNSKSEKIIHDEMVDFAIDRIADAPTEDVAPIIYGKWLAEQGYIVRDCREYYYYKCSVCGREVLTTGNPSKYFPYCHCGAKMEESGKKE